MSAVGTGCLSTGHAENKAGTLGRHHKRQISPIYFIKYGPEVGRELAVSRPPIGKPKALYFELHPRSLLVTHDLIGSIGGFSCLRGLDQSPYKGDSSHNANKQRNESEADNRVRRPSHTFLGAKVLVFIVLRSAVPIGGVRLGSRIAATVERQPIFIVSYLLVLSALIFAGAIWVVV